MATAVVRTMSLGEIETLIDWAAAEGWNPGLADAAAFHAADPDGFIGAFSDGALVAGIAAVKYGAAYGFIGLYITRTDKRGHGYGKMVWDAGMRRLAGRTVGLDGVDAQVENYRRKGFEPAYRTVRYTGRLAAKALERNAVVERITPRLWPRLLAFDSAIFGAPREAFLAKWLSEPHVAFAHVQDGSILGYAVGRRCREGWKIGPLFANRKDVAIELLVHAAAELSDCIAVDVPEARGGFSAYLSRSGLKPVFHTTRMFLGRANQLNESVFGVSSLELG